MTVLILLLTFEINTKLLPTSLLFDAKLGGTYAYGTLAKLINLFPSIVKLGDNLAPMHASGCKSMPPYTYVLLRVSIHHNGLLYFTNSSVLTPCPLGL